MVKSKFANNPEGQDPEEQEGVSRRSFLKLGGLVAGTALVSTGVMGCTTNDGGTTSSGGSTPAGNTPDKPIEYKVYESDMIVIGAGFGTSSAVAEAMRQGKKVTIIDKGPFGFSGGAGMNWDVVYTWATEGNNAIDTVFTRRIINKQLFVNAALSDPYQPNDIDPIVNWGESLPQRNADGTVHYKFDYPQMRGVEWGFPRHWLDHIGKQDNVTIHDYTMITDIFVNDGVCIGVAGIYLPTGEFRVYRAKATLLCTGAACWLYGWKTVSPISLNVPDNTSDVDMAIFRKGGRIGEAEHAAYDVMGIWPTGWTSSEGSSFGGDSMDIEFFLDKDGVAFCMDPELDQDRMLLDRPYFNRVVAQVIMEGRGGPNGGVFLPANDEIRKQMRYMYLRNVNLIEAKTGADLSKEPIECCLEMYEHGGTPIIDDNMMSTEFPGLFCVRGAAVYGDAGGTNQNRNRVLGSYAFRAACEYIDKTYKEPTSIDWSGVEAEFSRLTDLRTRDAGGLRPVEIMRNIQKVSYEALGVIRPLEALEKARTELKRILDEDIPKMTCGDHSTTYNRDWKEAIETINLLDLARLGVEGTYVRPESRGNFYRPEYPDSDDEWACTLGFKDGGNGELSFDKIFWPDVPYPA